MRAERGPSGPTRSVSVLSRGERPSATPTFSRAVTRESRPSSFSNIQSISKPETGANRGLNASKIQSLSEFIPTIPAASERFARAVGPDVFNKTVPFVPNMPKGLDLSESIAPAKHVPSFDFKNSVVYTPKVEKLSGAFAPIDLGQSREAIAPPVVRKDLPAKTETKVSLIKEPRPQTEKVNLVKADSQSTRPRFDIKNTVAYIPSVETATMDFAPIHLGKAIDTPSPTVIRKDLPWNPEPKVSLIKEPKNIPTVQTLAETTQQEEAIIVPPVAQTEKVNLIKAQAKPLQERAIVVPVSVPEKALITPANVEKTPSVSEQVSPKQEYIVVDLRQKERTEVVPVVLNPTKNPNIMVEEQKDQPSLEVALAAQKRKQIDDDLDMDELILESAKKKRIAAIREELAREPVQQSKIIESPEEPSVIDSVSSLMSSEAQSTTAHADYVVPEPLKLTRTHTETVAHANGQEEKARVATEALATVVSLRQPEQTATTTTIIPPTTKDLLPTAFKDRKPQKMNDEKKEMPFTVDTRAIKARIEAAKAVFDIFPQFDFQISLTADAIAAALPKRSKETTQHLSQVLGTGDLSDVTWRQELAGDEKVTRMDVFWKILHAIYKYPPVRIHSRGEHVTETYASWTVSGKAAEADAIAA